MTAALRWLVGLALIVAAGVVVALEPGEQVRQAPFIETVPLGVDGVGRNLEVRYTDVRLADSLLLEDSVARTQGLWVVVDLVAMNLTEPTGSQSFLLVDGFEYRGLDRLSGGFESDVLVPGIPTEGTVFFEVPRQVSDRTVRVALATGSDWRLDSAIAIDVDLSTLRVEDRIEIARSTRVAP
ncbi:hypothetical protein M2152_000802 [Microbacteriaceae bacterium SG_E_30_P1]|uniref:DUF4352 domain-containing protein n=1 Tax=Antiquaquibacter oligotrophicus TaxID=2880260 RepID=A0ABT6KKV8_9MICO|nr:hypothetical protein [Antiquaquibacter oligotrophicus]MDH6180620.1 hypothetical protein [Antiquaquibacter oligotrophicus]UDF13647.1 hypothetical protein LH407_02000 [Antiquaquibacter oligotrophicus]